MTVNECNVKASIQVTECDTYLVTNSNNDDDDDDHYVFEIIRFNNDKYVEKQISYSATGR